MRILIVEDEQPAAGHLKNLLLQVVPDADILGPVDSVRSAVEWFRQNPAPDLVMLDIHLADGISFEIFDQAEVRCPVIFTTAYNQYAIKAFKVNSVDYLLKPIDKEELRQAIDKYRSHWPEVRITRQLLEHLQEGLSQNYRTRFVVRVGEHLRAIPVDRVLFFYSLQKSTFMHTFEGMDYALDYSLDTLEEQLNPEKFFRINRRYIISLDAVEDIIAWSGSRLKIELKGSNAMDAVVSRERVSLFRKWLDR
ncbi:MAG: LytTR family DNA-binding domain-containing protein [Bacteroidales bacterium]